MLRRHADTMRWPQMGRDARALTSAHSAPHRGGASHTPPLSPVGPLPLDALLGFSGTSGDSSPEHSGPRASGPCGSSASGRGSTGAAAGRPPSPPLPHFPSFGDDLSFIQVPRTRLLNPRSCRVGFPSSFTDVCSRRALSKQSQIPVHTIIFRCLMRQESGKGLVIKEEWESRKQLC